MRTRRAEKLHYLYRVYVMHPSQKNRKNVVVDMMYQSKVHGSVNSYSATTRLLDFFRKNINCNNNWRICSLSMFMLNCCVIFRHFPTHQYLTWMHCIIWRKLPKSLATKTSTSSSIFLHRVCAVRNNNIKGNILFRIASKNCICPNMRRKKLHRYFCIDCEYYAGIMHETNPKNRKNVVA